MKLPKVNPYEELEQLSRDFIRPLFNIEKFEIRDELQRDKGIDLSIELKNEGSYTGYRFIVQLKATEQIQKNIDGSFSLSIETSNTNYLLNNSLLSVYIFYHKPSNKFYYEWVHNFLNSLSANEKDWQEQDSNTLRFSKELNGSSIDEFYKLVFKKGIHNRKMNEILATLTAQSKSTKITIDKNLAITDDEEVIKHIEKFGLLYINEGRSREIIDFSNGISKLGENTFLYCYVVGIAHYYCGRLYESITYFKKALKLDYSLTTDAHEIIHYYDTAAKYSLGIIGEQKYNDILQVLEKTPFLEGYIKLEKAKHSFINDNTFSRYTHYTNALNEIIESSGKDDIVLLAKCELLDITGGLLNRSIFKSIADTNIIESSFNAPIVKLRVDNARIIIARNRDYNRQVEKIHKEIISSNNGFILNIFNFFIAKSKYSSIACFNYFTVEREIPEYSMPKMDYKIDAEDILEKINIIINKFEFLGHYANLCAALSLKYELLHFIEDYDDANLVLKKLENLIIESEVITDKYNFDRLKNGGSQHEKYKNLYENTVINPNKVAEEFIAEMEIIDTVEFSTKGMEFKLDNPYHIIEIYPMGHFQFIHEKKEHLFNILSITNNEAIESVNFLFAQSLCPVINMLFKEITKEGYRLDEIKDGVEWKINFIGSQIDIYKRMHHIRVKLYENDIFRFVRRNSH